MHNQTTAIFSGRSNKELAEQIVHSLSFPIELGDIDIGNFSDGELFVEINESVRDKNAYIIQSTSWPVNSNIMELLMMSDALHRASAQSITAVIPYYGYARQDRRPDFTRTPITSKLVADMIMTSHIDRVITVDLHSGQQQGFFGIPILNLSASPEIVGDIWRTQIKQGKRVVIVSPDVGGVARARKIAEQVGNVELAIIDKRREKANHSEVMNIIGDVNDSICIIVDDLIDTAGTLCNASDALKRHGASSVVAYATHPVFSGCAYERISKSSLDEVVVTNTIEMVSNPHNIRQLSVGKLIGESLDRVIRSKSVSGLFS